MQVDFTLQKILKKQVLFLTMFFGALFHNGVQAQVRVYAVDQTTGATGICVGCVVTNPQNSVNANHSDYAALNLTLGLAVPPATYQTLIFPSASKPAAGTVVSIKLGTGDQILSLDILGAITVQAFNGNTAIDRPVAASSLVSALNNNNQIEISFTPNQNYDRVRVTLNGGVVAALSSIYLYGAYFNFPTATVACDAAVDELNGISSGLLGLGADVGGVVKPEQAIDGNLNTASTLNAGVGVAGAFAQQTIVFSNASILGDSVRLTLSLPQTLLDAGVLSNIQVSTANGVTDNHDAQSLNSSLLNVRLLDVGADGSRKVTVAFAPAATFDRVQLRLGGGIANALSTLNFYEAQRLIPRPVLSINGVVANNTTTCTGSSVTLSAASRANTIFKWYTAATGGNAVFTGNSFQTPALTATTTYYAEAVRNGCTNASERSAVTINISAVPADPVISNDTVAICSGGHASFTAQNIAGVTYSWYTAATGGTAIFTGNTFTTPDLTASATYYAEAAAGACTSADRTAVIVNVNSAPANFAVNPSTQTVNAGESAIFTASSSSANTVFNWYNSATGGTSFYTGATFTTPALFANTTYYAEAVSASGCLSATRIAVTANVNATTTISNVPCDAAINQTNDVNGLVCVGCSVTNPQNAVNVNSNSYSQLNVPAGLVNAYAQQTLRFANTGSAGDSVVVDLGLPSSLADVSLLSQIQLATYNGSVYNNDRFSINNSTANIRVLADHSRIRIAFPATKDFDRVEIRLNSAAALLTSLKIYDAAQEVAAPVVSAASLSACANMQTTLTATVPDHVTVNWYNAPTGGTPVFTGSVFTTPNLSATTTYYAEAERTTSGCVQNIRTAVTVNVTPQPALPVVNTDSVSICAGQHASFTAQNVVGIVNNWYTTPTDGTPVFTGNTFVSDTLNSNTQFYVEAVANGQCISAARKQVTVDVTDAVTAPVVAQTSVQTCAGTSATLSASSPQPNVSFQWFDSATAATPVFTGTNFTTPVLTANQSYFVQAISGDCVSADKVKVDVIVNPAPDAPMVMINPASGQVSAGQSATLTASSATPATTFRFYAQPNDGTPLFEGATFTTPALSSDITYYVEAVSPSGCVSLTRTPVNISVNPVFSTTCDLASTQTNNISNLCVGCTITDANNAVNADVTQYTRYQIPAGTTGGNITQQLIFADQGVVGDTVQILVRVPGSVISAQTLNGLQLSSYNGTTSNNDQVSAASNLVGLQVLSGGDEALLKFAPQTAFDRVELQLNAGAASALNMLDVFYATKQVSLPQLTQNVVDACSGSNAVFTVANPRSDVTYEWFDAATGGNLLYTGTTFTSPVLTGSTTYYVQSKRTFSGCVNPTRVAATATVTPTPPVPVLAQASFNICAGESVNLSVTNIGDNTINWYDAATGGNLLFSGDAYQTSSLLNSTHIYAEAANGNCISPTRADVLVTINPRPAQPGFVMDDVTVCAGSSATLEISHPESNVNYEWFTSQTGGNAVFTGIKYATPALTQNTTYYVQAKSATGCINNGGRANVNVQVTNSINQPVLSSTQSNVCAGGTVTVSVVNPSSSLVYNWFTTASGGAPVFTGTSFTINNITSNATYYVEASNNAGCTSALRKATTVTVIPAPNQPEVEQAGLMVCEGYTTTLRILNPQPNLAYKWYREASGGIPIFSGNEFTTPPLTANTIYYVEAASSQSCNPSTRLAIKLKVNTLPNAPVLTTESVTVCPADKATFSVASPVAGVVYRWFDSPAKTNKLFEGSTFVTSPLTKNTDFYVDAVSASGCVSSAVTVAHVIVSAAPSAPLVVNQNISTCNSSQVTLSVASPQSNLTYNWYNTATGGNILYTGTDFTTPAITANTTYYVGAIRNNNCASASRTAVNITVNNSLQAPAVSTQGTAICAGNSTTLSATADAGATIKWYANATGGTALATGNTFATPVLTASTTYYAEASSANSCSSATRTPVTVTVGSKLTAPIVNVTAVTASQVTFGWNAVKGATGYEISLDNGATFTAAGSGSTALGYTVTGLNPAQTVSIIVRAKGASDCQLSASSINVAGTTKNPIGDLVWVPNAFTPNGDGNNDVLYVYGNTIKTLNFNVYSQWGELLFTSTSTASGWDGTYKGKLEPVGVYVYYLQAVNEDGQMVKLKGTINLIR